MHQKQGPGQPHREEPIAQSPQLNQRHQAQIAPQLSARLGGVKQHHRQQRATHHINHHNQQKQLPTPRQLAVRVRVPQPKHQHTGQNGHHQAANEVNAGSQSGRAEAGGSDHGKVCLWDLQFT